MKDVTLKQQIADLKNICFDRISNLVKENGLDDGDEYVIEFKKNRRLVFYIAGEKVCIDRISLVKESGDLFGENIDDFDDIVKYNLKKTFSVEDLAAIESHIDDVEKPILEDNAEEMRYILIWEEKDDVFGRDTDIFDDNDTAIMVMNDYYLKWVDETKLISGIEKKITDDMAYVKVGDKIYYMGRIISASVPFVLVVDVFDDNYKTFEFFKLEDAKKFAEEKGFEDYIII